MGILALEAEGVGDFMMFGEMVGKLAITEDVCSR